VIPAVQPTPVEATVGAPVPVVRQTPAAAELLDRRLAELFAEGGPDFSLPYDVTDFSLSPEFVDDLSEDLGELFEDAPPYEPIPPAPVPFDIGDLEELDLTLYSEERFTAGISSQGGPLGE
jgi:hypothetical protein